MFQWSGCCWAPGPGPNTGWFSDGWWRCWGTFASSWIQSSTGMRTSSTQCQLGDCGAQILQSLIVFWFFCCWQTLGASSFFQSQFPWDKDRYQRPASALSISSTSPVSTCFRVFPSLLSIVKQNFELLKTQLTVLIWIKLEKNWAELSLVFLHFGPIYLRINWKTGSDNQRPLRVNNLLLGSGDVQTFKLTFAINSINSFSDNFFVNFLKSFWVI